VINESQKVTMALLEPPSNLLELLRTSLTEPNDDDRLNDDEDDIVISYMSFLASGLADEKNFEAQQWKDVLEPYLIQHYEQKRLKMPAGSEVSNGSTSSSGQKSTDQIINDFCLAAERALTDQDDAESYGDDDEDAKAAAVCDVRFNLAYGGKILLHQTRLHLLQGRRYALVGQNGVGKTTLMNAISTGKIDGWPTNLVTAYVDSGSNVDPAYMAQNVLQYVVKATSGNMTEQQCSDKLKNELDFTDSMLNGSIGELSGGWQMKLKLARATMTYPPVDVFLLDEPTNHLSASAVKWITDYLQTQLTHQTTLTVSHDTTFLEATSTDVIHYELREQVWGPYRKLVHYKGTMSEFVQKQPQAKHYFELATTDMLKFEFPDPGRLEGVKTSTQKFMELQNVDFRYRGASTNNLTNINLKMTLSSRVVVLGAVRFLYCD
jgi:elongation factor 3